MNSVAFLEALPCIKDCPYFCGTLQGEGVECYWDDPNIKEDCFVFSAYNPHDEYNRCNSTVQIIDLNIQRRKLALSQNRIRKIDNYYEYCMIEDYEKVFEFECAQAVKIGDVFVNLLEVDNRLVFASIQFPMSEFDIDGIIDWLNKYAIHWEYSQKDEGKISGAKETIAGVKFRGCPIILYSKGKKLLVYDAKDFVEVTEKYINFEEQKNHLNYKLVTDEPELKIYINGKRVLEIPRIEFEQENLIISNGNFIIADYMDDYFGSIGFFQYEDPALPVTWIHEKDTSVYIELQENDEFGLVCILKFSYGIDLDEL